MVPEYRKVPTFATDNLVRHSGVGRSEPEPESGVVLFPDSLILHAGMTKKDKKLGGQLAALSGSLPKYAND
jgi:hypothetical protein